jgi:hypothetical protein
MAKTPTSRAIPLDSLTLVGGIYYSDEANVPSDSTPNQFTFTDQTSVALSSTITSAAITVSGINTTSAITVTGGTYDINGSGSFTSSAGTVSNGDTVRARHTSSGTNSTATNTTVTIGGVSDEFRSTTLAEAGDWQLAAGHFIPAKMAPNIIHPRPDGEMNAWARAARCPSDIPWRIPIVVQGGAWPFLYEIVSDGGATGLTITETLPTDWIENGLQDYGVLSWASPVVGTYAISVKVTDQDLTEVTRDFTLEVISKENTTYFLFFDATTGSDAASGAYSTPKQTHQGWYNSSKTNNAHQGKQCFFFEGTYSVADLGGFGGVATQADMTTVKPAVFVGIPGEAVTFDLEDTCYWDVESGPGDTCFDNIAWINCDVNLGATLRKQFVRIAADPSDRSLFFRNNFDGGGTTTSTDSNESCVMYSGGGGLCNYSAISQCVFNDCDYMDLALYYSVFDHVVEGCSVTGTYTSNDHWGFFIKGHTLAAPSGDERFTFRAITAISSGIDRPIVYLSEFTDGLKGDIEVCWSALANTNTYTDGPRAGGFGIGQGGVGETHTSNYGNLWSYRNIYINPHITITNFDAGGPIEFENDVIEHSGSFTDGFNIVSSDQAATGFIKTDLLTGTSNIVDAATGKLHASQSASLGTHGREVA